MRLLSAVVIRCMIVRHLRAMLRGTGKLHVTGFV